MGSGLSSMLEITPFAAEGLIHRLGTFMVNASTSLLTTDGVLISLNTCWPIGIAIGVVITGGVIYYCYRRFGGDNPPGFSQPSHHDLINVPKEAPHDSPHVSEAAPSSNAPENKDPFGSLNSADISL